MSYLPPSKKARQDDNTSSQRSASQFSTDNSQDTQHPVATSETWFEKQPKKRKRRKSKTDAANFDTASQPATAIELLNKLLTLVKYKSGAEKAFRHTVRELKKAISKQHSE